MLHKLKNRKDEGFTIIEVLIVLAIAALILVVVLIAVPNLQRSQRNSARKDEASRVLTAANNYVSNTNGTILTSTSAAGGVAAAKAIIADSGTLQQFTGLANGTTNAMVFGATAATAPLLTIVTGGTAMTSQITKTGPGMALAVGQVCDNASPGATTTTGATPRSLVLVYTLEESGGTFSTACIGS